MWGGYPKTISSFIKQFFSWKILFIEIKIKQGMINDIERLIPKYHLLKKYDNSSIRIMQKGT